MCRERQKIRGRKNERIKIVEDLFLFYFCLFRNNEDWKDIGVNFFIGIFYELRKKKVWFRELFNLVYLIYFIQCGFIVAFQVGFSRARSFISGISKFLGRVSFGSYCVAVEGFVCYYFFFVDSIDLVLEISWYFQVNRIYFIFILRSIFLFFENGISKVFSCSYEYYVGFRIFILQVLQQQFWFFWGYLDDRGVVQILYLWYLLRVRN